MLLFLTLCLCSVLPPVEAEKFIESRFISLVQNRAARILGTSGLDEEQQSKIILNGTNVVGAPVIAMFAQERVAGQRKHHSKHHKHHHRKDSRPADMFDDEDEDDAGDEGEDYDDSFAGKKPLNYRFPEQQEALFVDSSNHPKHHHRKDSGAQDAFDEEDQDDAGDEGGDQDIIHPETVGVDEVLDGGSLTVTDSPEMVTVTYEPEMVDQEMTDAQSQQPPTVVNAEAMQAVAKTQGVMFYMFLANDGFPLLDIWMKHFEGFTRGVDYEMVIHCQDEAACRANPDVKNNFVIATQVPSDYCKEHSLVYPILQMLNVATKRRDHPHITDRFIVMSHNILPVKSFLDSRWTFSRAGSDFCLVHDLTQDEVTPVCSMDMKQCMVKHISWSVFDRETAERIVEVGKNSAQQLPIEWTPLKERVKLTAAANSRFEGCIDEWWFFSAAYGYVDLSPMYEREMEASRTGEFLEESLPGYHARCNTYQIWKPDYKGTEFIMINQTWEEVIRSRPTSMSLMDMGGPFGPHVFETVSVALLDKMKKSGFVFFREVDGDFKFESDSNEDQQLSRAELYSKYVFS